MLNPLAIYALDFILQTSPAAQHRDESPLAYVERAAEIASDIASEATASEPLFRDDDSRTRTTSLLLAVAFFESGFQLYVDRGLCLQPAWRQTARGHALVIAHADCDGMEAGSIFQIHGGQLFQNERIAEPFELVADRKLAVRTAIKMIRIDTSLGAYAGGQLEKARARRSFADRWYAAHSTLPSLPGEEG
jgi:hypothetical protein